MRHSTRLHYSGHGMKRAFHIRPRTRRRLAWLVALLLLWQQVAVAAYACATVPASPADPNCQQHCQPDHATQVDVRTASVPLNVLTALPPMSLSVAAVRPPSHRAGATGAG